ncbi:hypothetical protein IHN63_02670 [Deinococcus sp. 6YEL10]|uniref:hypothetical protein n=1 Tax=Deinococcus sp. 6YEL10 TaxID=2745870 RepID=UPI001E3DBEFD|nr:hypothetical protein [Deinococcus sp. 6YEL10]MCD0160204.1 hypothetical protein [Deinococcus sp. 6YEL10]
MTAESKDVVGVTEWAILNGLHLQTVHGLLKRGRVTGARQENGRWLIPRDAPVPPMRASRAPLVTAPDGLQALANWAIEHKVSEHRALAAHRDAGTLTRVNGHRFVPPGPLMPDHLPIAEWAKREDLSPAYAIQMARAGQLEGAVRVARAWKVPRTLTYVRQRKPRT